MKRVDELISKLENDLHIEFLGSRRAEAKRIIARWLTQYDPGVPGDFTPEGALKAKREILDPFLGFVTGSDPSIVEKSVPKEEI